MGEAGGQGAVERHARRSDCVARAPLCSLLSCAHTGMASAEDLRCTLFIGTREGGKAKVTAKAMPVLATAPHAHAKKHKRGKKTIGRCGWDGKERGKEKREEKRGTGHGDGDGRKRGRGGATKRK